MVLSFKTKRANFLKTEGDSTIWSAYVYISQTIKIISNTW